MKERANKQMTYLYDTHWSPEGQVSGDKGDEPSRLMAGVTHAQDLIGSLAFLKKWREKKKSASKNAAKRTTRRW